MMMKSMPVLLKPVQHLVDFLEVFEIEVESDLTQSPQTSFVLSATGSLELRLVLSATLVHRINNTSGYLIRIGQCQ